MIATAARLNCSATNLSNRRLFASQAYEAVGKKVAEENLAHISSMMATFKGSLQEFARKYKKNINQDPAFRQQFQVMCANIG